jgi:hypothetical protein
MSQTELLARLACMVKALEPGSTNLGAFVEDHAEDLSKLFGAELICGWTSQSDEAIAREVAPRLRSMARVQREERRARARARSENAARVLGQTARWLGDQAFLDSDLLDDLVADRQCRAVRFKVAGSFDVVLLRDSVAKVSRIRRLGKTAWVDASGLHLRWNGTRGGCNLRAQENEFGEASVILVSIGMPKQEREEGTWVCCVLLGLALEVTCEGRTASRRG